MPFNRISDLLKCLNTQKFHADNIICKKGEEAYDFYIVKNGIVNVYDDAAGRAFQKFYFTGDWFGESAVTGGYNKRMAYVVAYTDCELLSLNIYNFKWIFGDSADLLYTGRTKVADMLQTISEKRYVGESEIIESNMFVSK